MGSNHEETAVAEIDFGGLSDAELDDIVSNDTRTTAVSAAEAEQNRRADAGTDTSEDARTAAEEGIAASNALNQSSVMPLHEPLDSAVPFEEREPDKVIPADGSDGAETPSGHALRVAGEPPKRPLDEDPEDVAEQRQTYREEKFKMRHLR